MANLLLKQMEQTREMMIRSGVENGLQNANTIRLSRQLDQLMNTYYEEQLLTESVPLNCIKSLNENTTLSSIKSKEG
ncbi:Spo0E family sporulation regulatory protein-aspartic acid phosphatase [Lysinibacillus sp. NPDC096418]|uniref:Spo0E family sporulation regulatory protein-aspartic acid phosphatase n=1 Tax=Lysinibacillus sp. NPDC096418 TaxID=3364138 RepID=UPI00382471E3